MFLEKRMEKKVFAQTKFQEIFGQKASEETYVNYDLH